MTTVAGNSTPFLLCYPSFFSCKGSIWTISPFTYWKSHGLVTGGAYGSCEGCRPYSFEPHCGAPCSIPKYSKTAKPKCSKSCQENYSKSREEDTYRGKSAYWLRVWVLGPHLDNVRCLLENMTTELDQGVGLGYSNQYSLYRKVPINSIQS